MKKKHQWFKKMDFVVISFVLIASIIFGVYVATNSSNTAVDYSFENFNISNVGASNVVFDSTTNATKQLRAEIKPANATNKGLKWHLCWVDVSVTDDIDDYLELTVDTADSQNAVLKCIKAFGNRAKAIATSVENSSYKTECVVDYKQQVLGLRTNFEGDIQESRTSYVEYRKSGMLGDDFMKVDTIVCELVLSAGTIKSEAVVEMNAQIGLFGLYLGNKNIVDDTSFRFEEINNTSKGIITLKLNYRFLENIMPSIAGDFLLYDKIKTASIVYLNECDSIEDWQGFKHSTFIVSFLTGEYKRIFFLDYKLA